MMAHLTANFEPEEDMLGKIATGETLSAQGGEVPVVHHKRLYMVVSRALMRHRGIERAVHDARDILKAICLTPRHPEGQRPRKLRGLPMSLYVDQAVRSASTMDPTLGRKDRNAASAEGSDTPDSDGAPSTGAKGGVAAAGAAMPDGAAAAAAESTDDAVPLEERASRKPLDAVLSAVRGDLGWPAAAVAFLEQCLIARGGFKALAMVSELRAYHTVLQDLEPRIRSAIGRFRAADTAEQVRWRSWSRDSAVGDADRQFDLGNWLSAAVLRGRQILVLESAEAANVEHSRWVNRLLTRVDRLAAERRGVAASDDCGAAVRLFVAGDNIRRQLSCANVPKDFLLGGMTTAPRGVLRAVVQPAIDAAIVREGWPPRARAGGSRPRVRAYSAAAAADIATPLPPSARHTCADCSGRFDSVWVHAGVCAVCIEARRCAAIGTPKCIFDCKLAEKAWCPHAGRCFVCDTPHSCEDGCRLGRGDGETVCATVNVLQPTLLCLDFDRTLCTTRNGGTPLPQSGRVKHTIDSELKAAAALHPSAHVVTRNSYKADIEAFLQQEGLPNMRVHVVPKKVPKGKFIFDTFFDAKVDAVAESGEAGTAQPITCLFVDDDIRELVMDPWLRTDPRVHRIHFVRAL
jgi:hypothetical protein